MSILWQYRFLLFIWLLAALLAGCTASSGAPTATPSLALTTVFPDEITGWTPAEEARIYKRENIFDLVNGQAVISPGKTVARASSGPGDGVAVEAAGKAVQPAANKTINKQMNCKNRQRQSLGINFLLKVNKL